MNGKDLLIGLGDISQKYYQEAEQDVAVSGHRRLKRPLLVAAIIALTLALVGCAVVYALRLQDMSIGKETYTQTFDEAGKYLEEPVEKTRDIITIYGHSGDPIQKALTEWFEFLNTYDPDGKLMDNNPDHEEIPNQYEYTYSCYTADMVAKVDEIAEKYDLKLLEEPIVFQAWEGDLFLEESGIGSLVRPDNGGEMTRISGTCYPPYNFNMDIEFKADTLETKLWATVVYSRKDYLPSAFPGAMDLDQFEQWDYTAPDGTKLLLARSKKGSAYIIAELENAMLVYSIDGNFARGNYPTEEEIITKEQLELAADVFDYSIQPQLMDIDAVKQKIAEAEEAHYAAQAYVPETYGSFGEYIKSNYYIYDDDLQYLFYDMTGDGEAELLIGRNGYYDRWITIRDGQTMDKHTGAIYLCEGGIIEYYYGDDLDGTFETHHYAKPLSETAIDDIELEWKTITVLKRMRNQWTQGDVDLPYYNPEITEAEAKAIIAQYPRLELDWQPLMEFPLDENGYTFGDYLKDKDVRVSDEELLEIYRDRLNGMQDMYYSHYRILDINGDGVKDLLLKGEDDSLVGKTDFYWTALTYRYGTIKKIAADFYLCEDGVLEKVSTRHDYPGIEINGHWFMRISEFEEDRFAFVAYNKATASWQGDWYNNIPMTEEEANAILSQYPRVDQGMRPIEELLN